MAWLCQPTRPHNSALVRPRLPRWTRGLRIYLWSTQPLPPSNCKLLEALRPLVHYVCSRLHKNTREKLAPAHVLAHALPGSYEVVFEQARLTAMQDKDQRDILTRSAHRLLSELGRVGLYCFQQYRDLPTNY
jgi:hypothetical protein